MVPTKVSIKADTAENGFGVVDVALASGGMRRIPAAAAEVDLTFSADEADTA